jgi:hypothetical protein
MSPAVRQPAPPRRRPRWPWLAGLPAAAWSSKSAVLFSEFQTQRRPLRDKALAALMVLLDQDGELARTYLTRILETCDHSPTLIATVRAALRDAPDRSSVLAAALEVTARAKAKQAKALWPVRMFVLSWHLVNKVDVPDPEPFSPFTKEITAKLRQLSGRLPLVPPTDPNEQAFCAWDDSPPQRRVLSYAERYLLAALRSTTLRYQGQWAPQDFEASVDFFVHAKTAYIQFGWLPISQFHVMLSYTGEGMGLNPLVYESDHGPVDPMLAGPLSTYLRQLRA